jgi:predicted naringenin-chalcone synthase
MSEIVSIGTATPTYKHEQKSILNFMLNALKPTETEARRISLMYHRCGIESRYSFIPDYSTPIEDWEFYPQNESLEPFPNLEKRMEFFYSNALELSLKAIEDCMQSTDYQAITHLITVTCTGLSAPGLDIQIMQRLNLRPNLIRTSVNFMGCYAAIHALKIADAFCKTQADAKVLIVCSELCTLHFQRENKADFITSGLLFGDGSAACLVQSKSDKKGLKIKNFYSKVALNGQSDMAWHLSSNGFLMTLSNHIPKLVESEIENLLKEALADLDLSKEEIKNWAIHPGGKDILEAARKALSLSRNDLDDSSDILRSFGNMSSPTILFVLKRILSNPEKQGNTFAVAFGPGITMESVVFSV